MTAVGGLVDASLKAGGPPGGALSCLLLGEEPLLVHCADVLLERGHRIVGIVSQAAAIARWATEHGVSILSRAEYPRVVEREVPDVLLSITHPALIRPEVLRRARIAAINYHDGPLPRYAGMNGSAWALHNGEHTHAVVWHYITDGLDDGDILERRDVDLDPRETSVSLNMKNAALALDGFRAIVDRLEARDLAGTPQSGAIARTVYSRHDRPPGLCIIDWTASAEVIDHMIRACDFGTYPNRFGSPKLVNGSNAITVRESLPTPGAATAGQVLRVDADGLTIAAGAGALRLRGFATLGGAPLTATAAAVALGVQAGDVLAFDGLAEARAWSRRFAESEPFCVTALGDRNVPQLPFGTVAAAPTSCAVEVPTAFALRYPTKLPDALIAGFCATLSALLREDRFDIAVASQAPLPAALVPLCSRLLPWRIAIDGNRGFDSFVEAVAQARAERMRYPGFLLDLVSRHPSLRDQTDLQRGQVSTVAVVGEEDALPPGVELALRVRGQAAELGSNGALASADLASFAGWLQAVLARVAEDPTRPLATVDLLDDAQRARQLVDWNATARPFPTALRIHDLFDARAAGQPEAVALVHESASMRFAEVEAAANRIANALQARGIGPGQYVGLLAERGFGLVLGMLGIAKAGAAYVPVDTVYPVDRCRFMLEDAGCVAVLASSSLAARCEGFPIVLLDGEEVATAPPEPPRSTATSDDVCYAIYTSGSTGKPKGVVLSHRAVVNTLDWVNRSFGVGPGDRLLFVTSPSFDLSVYDVFGALGAGACVEIASSATLSDPQALAARLGSGSITIWDSAPPALGRLTSFFAAPAVSAGLRLVMLSGDWIPVGLPGEVMRAFPRVRVVSLGGATEAAIWSNHYEVEKVDPAWASIPYGYPIQNCRYYVLDHHLRPLPVGITGDLYIGGVCLAQGYLNRPELTQSRFLPNPFLPGERIYKTGDLARYWADGTLEFRGRADNQVKVRGFRVELGEVESELAAIESVAQAVCLAHPDASGQKALVAYVVPKDQQAFDARALKDTLAASLPDFMVPSFIIPLEALPLSANGKLDRKALPKPESYRPRKEYRPPRTPTERALSTIWQDLLKRWEIGVDEAFFDLGGHSLLAVKLMESVKQQLDTDVPLSRVLECPTIELLAASIDEQQRTATSGGLTPLRAGGPRRFFFIHDGDGETLLYRSLAQRLPEDFGVFGVLPKSLPGVGLAHGSIEDMARYCLDQVRRLQPHGPYHLGGLCAGGVIAFQMAAELEREGEKAESIVLLEAFHPRAFLRQSDGLSARLDRFRSAVRGDGGDASSDCQCNPALAGGLRRGATKLRHFAGYAVTSSLWQLAVTARLSVLRRVLENGRAWPSWLPPLRVRDIYMWASRDYVPPVLREGRVILVKATAAVPGVVGDEPGRDLYIDSLFGWGPYVASALEVLDVTGGHSTMLQEPMVADLAVRLNRFLRRGGS